jgi:SAM-dependent methyltransferase
VVLLQAFDEVRRLGKPISGMRVLSPGCGKGADALEIARQGAHVIAVDWSPAAVKSLQERSAEVARSPGSLEVVAGDFFHVNPQPVDYVAEHTFFCAIDPSSRPLYVERIATWVKPGGFLVGNFFVLSEEEAAALPALSLAPSGVGPPFVTTVIELERLLSPYFSTVVLQRAVRQESGRRPGMEWIGIFQRSAATSR